MTPTALELQEDGDTKIFGIQLTSEPLGNVRVHFDIDEPTAATLSKTELTFDGGNWDRRQEVTVSPVDDNIITGDRESYIVFKVATSTENDDAYNGLRLLNNIKVCEILGLDRALSKEIIFFFMIIECEGGCESFTTMNEGNAFHFAFMACDYMSCDDHSNFFFWFNSL